jgi:hypothetical protein
MKKFDMSLDKIKKVLNIRIWGMYTPDDANAFVEEFTKVASSVQAAEFILNFDAQELAVSKQEMLPMLEGCFKMYKTLGFKKVIANVGKNATLKMQLSRVGRNSGLVIEVI